MENTVYLDREQCSRFSVDYFTDGTLTLPADLLLRSKGGDGYDKEHHDILKPFGTQLIKLQRTSNDPPGWFHISKAL